MSASCTVGSKAWPSAEKPTTPCLRERALRADFCTSRTPSMDLLGVVLLGVLERALEVVRDGQEIP